jgi:uncharacterized protein YbaR (Trm112 family)
MIAHPSISAPVARYHQRGELLALDPAKIEWNALPLEFPTSIRDANVQRNRNGCQAVAPRLNSAHYIQMLQSKLIGLLRCPEDGSELTPASDDDLRAVNALIRSRRLVNRAGRTLDEPIDGGFVRAAGDILYPVIHQIPILIRDEGIELAQLNSA